MSPTLETLFAFLFKYRPFLFHKGHFVMALAWPAVVAGTDRWLPKVVARYGAPRVAGLRAAGAGLGERAAIELAARVVKGPQIARARFTPVKALGFDDPDTSGGRSLGKGVKFRKVETGHSPEGQTSGRAYLYFWPGGQTERASIQLMPEGATAEGATAGRRNCRRAPAPSPQPLAPSP